MKKFLYDLTFLVAKLDTIHGMNVAAKRMVQDRRWSDLSRQVYSIGREYGRLRDALENAEPGICVIYNPHVLGPSGPRNVTEIPNGPINPKDVIDPFIEYLEKVGKRIEARTQRAEWALSVRKGKFKLKGEDEYVIERIFKIENHDVPLDTRSFGSLLLVARHARF